MTPEDEGRIVVDPRVLMGKPVIKGTRIPVSLILNLIAHGQSFAEIRDDYPPLTEEDIQAAVAYAAAHLDREEIGSMPETLTADLPSSSSAIGGCE
jgi:uncharacterized protein (DUF433 family)